MAAPVGNQYAAKAQKMSRALDRALALDNYRRLHQGCDRLADAFAEGQPWALGMVFDRLEGKAVARVETSNADARELDMAAVMQLILQHRSATASDAQTLEPLSVQVSDSSEQSTVHADGTATAADTLPRMP